MKIEFRGCFARDLRRIRDRSLLQRAQETINEVEAAVSVGDIRDSENSGAKVATIASGWETTA